MFSEEEEEEEEEEQEEAVLTEAETQAALHELAALQVIVVRNWCCPLRSILAFL